MLEISFIKTTGLNFWYDFSYLSMIFEMKTYYLMNNHKYECFPKKQMLKNIECDA